MSKLFCLSLYHLAKHPYTTRQLVGTVVPFTGAFIRETQDKSDYAVGVDENNCPNVLCLCSYNWMFVGCSVLVSTPTVGISP